MTRTRRLGCAMIAAAACSLLSYRAHADSPTEGAGTGAGADACVAAYESAQEQRLRGSLVGAREQAATCAAPSCPAFIREDCTTWRGEIDAEVPSVTFDVTRSGARLTKVRVTEGERVVAERLEGAVELDPGEHSLRFEGDGAEPLALKVVLARGEKARRVAVELAPVAAPAPTEPRAAPSEPERSPNVVPWVLVGTGVAGVTAFTLLGASGLSEEAKLKRSCAPSCDEKQLQSVQTKYLLADVSLAIGIGGLIAGGYLLLTDDPRPAEKARAFPLEVAVGPRGGVARVSGKF